MPGVPDRLKHSTVNTMGKTAQTLAVRKMSSSITVHLPLVRLQTLSSSSLSRLRLDEFRISNTLHSAYLLPLQSHQLRCNLQSFAVFYFIRYYRFCLLFLIIKLHHCFTALVPLHYRTETATMQQCP